MIVQIYEIQTPFEAQKCIELGVEHIGSVIASQDEWKKPEIKELINLSKGTNSINSLIPLFQNKDRDILFKTLDYYSPQIVHLCNNLISKDKKIVDLNEFVETQNEIKKRFPQIKIMRSIPIPMNGVKCPFSIIDIAKKFEHVTDFYLTDTWLGTETSEAFIGITGKLVDLELSKKLVQSTNIPVILAGGLSADNVHNAILKTKPAGVDTCTLTNAIDQQGKPIRFKKDFKLVKTFISEAKK